MGGSADLFHIEVKAYTDHRFPRQVKTHPKTATKAQFY